MGRYDRNMCMGNGWMHRSLLLFKRYGLIKIVFHSLSADNASQNRRYNEIA